MMIVGIVFAGPISDAALLPGVPLMGSGLGIGGTALVIVGITAKAVGLPFLIAGAQSVGDDEDGSVPSWAPSVAAAPAAGPLSLGLSWSF